MQLSTSRLVSVLLVLGLAGGALGTKIGIEIYQQCGGLSGLCYTGDPDKPCTDTCWTPGCTDGLRCRRWSEWYYQCVTANDTRGDDCLRPNNHSPKPTGELPPVPSPAHPPVVVIPTPRPPPNRRAPTDTPIPSPSGSPFGHWEQCGGKGGWCDDEDPARPCEASCWPAGCEEGLLCTKQSEYYYQCLTKAENGSNACPEDPPAQCYQPPECTLWTTSEMVCCLGDGFQLDCRIEKGKTDLGVEMGTHANCELDWDGKAICQLSPDGKPKCDFTAMAPPDTLTPAVIEKTQWYLDHMCFGPPPVKCANPDPVPTPKPGEDSFRGCANWGNEASPGSQEFECEFLSDWQIECDADIATLNNTKRTVECELDPPEFNCPADLSTGEVTCDWGSPNVPLYGWPSKIAHTKRLMDAWCPTSITKDTGDNEDRPSDSLNNADALCPGFAQWEQCGGKGGSCNTTDPARPCKDECWPGGCAGNYMCFRQNPWYYQCAETGVHGCPWK